MMRRKRFRPPKKVQQTACKGLEQRETYNRGGTRIGLTRANQLCNGEIVSLQTVKRMDSFFDRHSAFTPYHGETPPRNSEISWNLWGGNEGRRWAKGIVEKEENK
jgi:hypothetical protein